jgi:bifunctional non-homologous end joining protein LigD
MSSFCTNYVVKESALSFKEGSSDKVYYVSLERVENDKCVVNFAFGRRGNALQTGTKTNTPVDFTTAQIIFDKLVQEKMKKGYKGSIISVIEKSESSSKVIPVIKTEEAAISKCVLLNAIKEEQVHDLLNNDDWMIQEKMDGVRYMLEFEKVLDGAKFKGYNRKGKEVPVSQEIKDEFESFDEHLPPDCFLDGELIGKTFYVFDILSIDADLRQESYAQRYNLLARYIQKYFLGSKYIKLVKAYGSKEEKEKLFNDSIAKEGVVFKRKSATYHVGRPASGGDYLKFKFCEYCTCLVTSVSNKRSVGIGLMNGSDIIEVGNVTIPVNYEIPTLGKYIEVKYLYAFSGGSLIQPVYLGERDDVEVDTIDSIKYKNSEDVED